MNLQPLADRLIVEVLEEEEATVSGIVLPDTAREKPQRGRVLAVGPGARDEHGKRIELDVAAELQHVRPTRPHRRAVKVGRARRLLEPAAREQLECRVGHEADAGEKRGVDGLRRVDPE